MLYEYLWSLAFVLALAPAGLMLRVIRLPEPGLRPVAVEIR